MPVLKPLSGELVSSFIARSLRLINVPGRGMDLGGDDLSDAFEALVELIESEGVGQSFDPGIHRHFFSLQSNKHIYKYGVGPSADLRSDDFDHPSPIAIETAYLRPGGTITDNEQVDEWRFENQGDWTVTDDAQIINNAAVLDGAGSVSQDLGLEDGTTYTLRLQVEVTAGTAALVIQGDGSDVVSVTVDSSGEYEFDFEFSGSTSSISITTSAATDDLTFSYVSLLERGADRLELVATSSATDYPLKVIDQVQFNRNRNKALGGRPEQLLYTRNFPLGDLRLDSQGSAGDVLIMDVGVNPAVPSSPEDRLRIHGNALLWLRHRLADVVAGEYGKGLRQRQIQIMDEAYDKMTAATKRPNRLRVDPGLLGRGGRFDIDRGD